MGRDNGRDYSIVSITKHIPNFTKYKTCNQETFQGMLSYQHSYPNGLIMMNSEVFSLFFENMKYLNLIQYRFLHRNFYYRVGLLFIC